MSKYRKKLDIMAEILQIVCSGAKKTQIMYKANLSHSLLQYYLAVMDKAVLIVFQADKRKYVITDKGLSFLQSYKAYKKCNKYIEKHRSEASYVKNQLEALSKSLEVHQ